jgi:hypothetical protein
MTCRHRDAIVDLARGEAIPSAVARAATSHRSGCRNCQVEFDRQRQLTLALGALADDARAWTVSGGAEQRFAAAVTVDRSGSQVGNAMPAVHPVVALRRRRVLVAAGYGLTAAAAFAAAIWLGGGERRSSNGPPAPVPGPSRPPANVESPARVIATRQDAVPRPVRKRGASRPRASAPAEPTRTLEFMEIPGAAGLPAFESGAIVRLELPVAALPTYGVAIAPDVGRLLVEADVLVGQDGRMRGIRLVSSDSDAAGSRSRQ